jgi:hypothetical protein
MKVTIEVEVNSLDEISNLLNSGEKVNLQICPNRLRLLKDVHTLAKQCVDNNRYPSLTETKDTIWPHFYSKTVNA